MLEDVLVVSGAVAWVGVLGAVGGGLGAAVVRGAGALRRRLGERAAEVRPLMDPVSGEARSVYPSILCVTFCLVCNERADGNYRARDVEAALAELRADVVANGWRPALGGRMVCAECAPAVIDR